MTTLRIAVVLFCSVDGHLPDNEGIRRLNKAIGLYIKKQVNQIMISGGCRNNIKLAEIYKQYLKSKGIRDSNIILEDKSSSTASNIKESSAKIGWLENHGGQIEKIYIITNFRHMKRVNILRRYYYWPWLTENTTIKPDNQISPPIKEFAKLIATIVDPYEKSALTKGFKRIRAKAKH